MTTMLLLLAQDWTVEVKGSDVKVSGKAAATLEFRRIVRRLEEGRLEKAPAEEVLVRKVSAGFTHVERFERPGPVEVKASSEDGRVFEATVRTGSAAAVATWASAGVKRITAAAEGLSGMTATGDRAKRRLAAWRASGEQSELPAAGAALAALAGDVEHALSAKAGRCPMLSSGDGRAFRLESLPERCAALVDLAERERDLAVLDALNALAEEAYTLAESCDVRRWTRAEPRYWRSIDHLKEAAGGRMSEVLARLSELIETGSAWVHCPGSDEGELERRREAMEGESRRLEESLR